MQNSTLVHRVIFEQPAVEWPSVASNCRSPPSTFSIVGYCAERQRLLLALFKFENAEWLPKLFAS